MRDLTASEIQQLENNGCQCRNWKDVRVENPFSPSNYHNVRFIGHILLGTTTGADRIIGGIPYSPGIANATICNCEIEANTYIYNIRGGISGYLIKEGVALIDCGDIVFEEGATCGEGTLADVLDETGSIPVVLHRSLTAQLAYASLIDAPFREAHNNMARRLIKSYGPTGTIGEKTYITHCGTIRNVNVGRDSRIEGALALSNGTLSGGSIGPGVIASDFIATGGSHITAGAHITRCFIGNNVTLDGLTAHDSLFFANSHLCNGEAAAIFAGPFTVSEHKSTLLIGGAFLMFNAGSGTNQSNHLYKLGPEYFGFTDRGTRCASDSYILWPAHIGAFTTILGRHYGHPDTTQFPFSYLIADEKGKSRLIPGIAIERISVERDTRKWAARDRRLPENRTDLITFNALNPHTISHIINAFTILKQIEDSGDYQGNGFYIANKDVAKGIARYEQALIRYFGAIIKEISGKGSELREMTPAETKWIDLGGFVTTQHILENLRKSIQGVATTLQLKEALEQFREKTETETENWQASMAISFMKRRYGVLAPHNLIEEYANSQKKHLQMLLAEGEAEGRNTGKDFTNTSLAEELRESLRVL